MDIYREILEKSPIAYVLIRIIKDNNVYKSFETLDMNKACEDMYKINKHDYINIIRKAKELSSKEEKEKWISIFEDAVINQSSSSKMFISKLNAYCDVEVYCREENEFHIQLKRLSQNVMKLSSVFKDSPYLGWIKNREGVYVDVNEAYAKYINKSIDYIIGKKDYDIWRKKYADEFSSQDGYVIEHRKLCKYGNYLNINDKKEYVEVSKWPYIDEEIGEVLGSIGIAIMVNDKIQLRKNIEKNEEIFKEIANTIEEVIIIRDDKKALYISPSFERIFKVSPENLNLYEDLNAFTNYWDSIEFEKDIDSYHTKEITRNICKLSKNGEDELWIMSSFAPVLDEEGNIIKKIGIISNITEKKKEHHELNNIKMDFLANISHELRTPINLILSCLQVLEIKTKRLEGLEKEFYNRYHSIINQNGLRLLKLVNNLIDTTKLDSGNFRYNPQNKDIINYVENICMSVSDFVETNNMKLVFDTNIEELIISFDEDNMERIILNLLSNAIKFNKPNGQISVIINVEEEVNISVIDNGIGIPNDKLNVIFDRFEQVKSKFEREKEGSGIGLSIVKSLVGMHNGKINVKSEINKGTDFTITLPIVLLESTNESFLDDYGYINNIGKMNVEFSDIY